MTAPAIFNHEYEYKLKSLGMNYCTAVQRAIPEFLVQIQPLMAHYSNLRLLCSAVQFLMLASSSVQLTLKQHAFSVDDGPKFPTPF
jgi:hypothetical protein